MKTNFTNINPWVSFKQAIKILIIWLIWHENLGPILFSWTNVNVAVMNILVFTGTIVFILIVIRDKNISFKLYKKDIFWIILGVGLMRWVDILSFKIESFVEITNITQNANQINAIAKSSPFLKNLLVIGLAPIAEELIYRVGIFRLFSRLGALWASIISGLVFGISHIFNALMVGKWYELIYLISYAGSGIILAFLYYKTKRIWIVIVIHLVYNLIATLF